MMERNPLLKQTKYNTASSLFNFTLPAIPHIDDIKKLVTARFQPYEIVLNDVDEWHDWFKFLTIENIEIASKLYSTIDLIENPLEQTDILTTTHDVTDENVANTSETANASSGYSHDGTKNDATTTDTTNTVNRNLDTPQARIENLDDGYLTSANKGNSSSNMTNSAETQADRSYLDAQSSNGTANTDRDVTRDETTHIKGYNGINKAEAVKQYRETLTNIKHQITDLWLDAFITVYDCDIID